MPAPKLNEAYSIPGRTKLHVFRLTKHRVIPGPRFNRRVRRHGNYNRRGKDSPPRLDQWWAVRAPQSPPRRRSGATVPAESLKRISFAYLYSFNLKSLTGGGQMREKEHGRVERGYEHKGLKFELQMGSVSPVSPLFFSRFRVLPFSRSPYLAAFPRACYDHPLPSSLPRTSSPSSRIPRLRISFAPSRAASFARRATIPDESLAIIDSIYAFITGRRGTLMVYS